MEILDGFSLMLVKLLPNGNSFSGPRVARDFVGSIGPFTSSRARGGARTGFACLFQKYTSHLARTLQYIVERMPHCSQFVPQISEF